MSSAAFAVEDTTTNQDNTSIASPTSTMSNVQVNSGSMARSTFGGGVGCSDATLSVSATRTPNFGNYVTATVAMPINSMFQTSDCEKAARTQTSINQQILTDMQIRRVRDSQLHNQVLAKRDAELAQVCIKLHGIMSSHQDSYLSSACSRFAPILKEHHQRGEINKALMPDNHSRISPNR